MYEETAYVRSRFFMQFEIYKITNASIDQDRDCDILKRISI